MAIALVVVGRARTLLDQGDNVPWFTAPCRRVAPSLALLRRYRLAPSPRGSAALLRRSVSVGFPQYPTHLLAVLSVRRAARCALTEIDLVTAREPAGWPPFNRSINRPLAGGAPHSRPRNMGVATGALPNPTRI